jgi:acyl dehydratase
MRAPGQREHDLEPIFYEDLQLGGVWTTRGRTLTEADFAAYAGVAGDFGPLHVDAEQAAKSHFGRRIAPGALLIGIAVGLGSMDAPHAANVALVGTAWRFMRPVAMGSTVRARWRLQRKRDVENPRWGLCSWEVAIVEGGEVAAEGDVSFLVLRREAAPPPGATRSRRGRRGRRKPAEQPLPPPEANLPPSGDLIPEPAPEDVPPAKTRRRRRSSTQPKPVEAPPADTAAVAKPSSRRRRRRRSNGNGNGNGSGNGNGDAGHAQVPAPAPAASEPAPIIVAPKEPGAVEKVLGRLTRRRRTSTPAG